MPDSPANRCAPSEKASAKGFPVCANAPSVVNVCGPSGSCLHNAAIVCKCAGLCSVIACSVTAISARVGDNFHLWRSCAFVQLRPWLSIAAWSYAFPLESARRYLQIFLSIRFNSPGDAAFASRPVIDALTIQDGQISRL